METPNIALEQVFVTPENEIETNKFNKLKQVIGRLSLVVALGLSGVVAEQHPAVAETGNYPDWNKPCVTQSDPDYGKTQGTGYWCDGYNWGDLSTGNTNSPRGYDYRNCTDWVAWKVQSYLGESPTGLGNANTWDDYAPSHGYTVTHSPEPGDAAVWNGGNYGHLAFVESVNADGSVNITEYNYKQDGNWWHRENVKADDYVDFDGIGVNKYGGSNPNTSGNGTVVFVKTKNTGTGGVEIHTATPSSNYQTGNHFPTYFSTAEQNSGWFQVVGPDLYYIKTKNAASGRVEVHSATGGSGYKSGEHVASAFGSADADNGWFQMDDVNTDGRQDLVFIKTKNTGSGRVEFFWANGVNNYQSITEAYPTAFSPGDASNGWFQAQGPNLIFIKTRNTGTGKVEYFRAPRSNGYKQITIATGTAFSPGDQNNGWFSSEDVNRDGVADLAFVKTHNTQSGQVEYFWASGANNFQNINGASKTWLSPSDANNGWFQADSKQ